MKEILDITYRTIGDTTLMLDLFLPDNVEKPPLILWIHGGAWMMGDRKSHGLQNQTERGYAVASIDYRLTTTAPFPACIEDCKYALAFIRKNANKYKINAEKICVAGNSAGGHLAALMGVTVGHADWEPENADCSIQAVIDFYGPISFRHKKLKAEDTPVLDALFGTQFLSKKGLMLATAASPITYINGTEPPFLIIHGDQDNVVSIKHSCKLRNVLEKHGCSVAMHTVFGGEHGNFNDPVISDIISTFLDYHFKTKGNKI